MAHHRIRKFNTKETYPKQKLDHVCRIVVYLTDIRYREAVYQEMGKWFKGVHPCSTGIVVQALARPEWFVEIEVTAVIPQIGAMTCPLLGAQE